MLSHPQEITAYVIKQGRTNFSGEIEVLVATHASLQIDVLDQAIEAIHSHKEKGIAIRVLDNGKLGFAYTSDLSQNTLNDCLQNAIHNAKCTHVNPYLSFALTSHLTHKLALYDNHIIKTPLAKKIELTLAIESAARQYDKRVLKTEKVTYEEAEYEIYLQTSGGFSGSYKGNHCGGAAQIMAGDRQTFEAGSGFKIAKKLKEINPQQIGQEAAEDALSLLGARSARSRKTTIVFNPKVAAQILGLLITPLSGEAVIKGQSLFAEKQDQVIAAKIINLIDDGQMKNGLATAPFDGEGTLTQRTVLVRKGVLRSFIHNIYSSRVLKVKPTGNGERSSYQSQPVVSPTNLYIENGKTRPDQLIKHIKEGIYVTRLMGLHTANPISGDFSFGIQGQLIENGEKACPIRGITLAGNLVELMQSIVAVGNDLRFSSSIGSPTLVVENLAVGGDN
jgi:PmbA protein